MRYYSDETKQFYASLAECEEAEAKAVEARKVAEIAAKKKADERKSRAKEVEDALKAAVEARKKYDELLTKFCKDYGSFHYSFNEDSPFKLFPDFFNWF